MRRAKEVSTWSKDTTKCGCVIANGKNHIAEGYNGFPSRIEDKAELISNREEKWKRTVHSEINAILRMYSGPYLGTDMYCYPHLPCFQCVPIILSTDIRYLHCVSNYPREWDKDTLKLLAEGNIKTNLYDESLLS